jgi:hypothetical protein
MFLPRTVPISGQRRKEVLHKKNDRTASEELAFLRPVTAFCMERLMKQNIEKRPGPARQTRCRTITEKTLAFCIAGCISHRLTGVCSGVAGRPQCRTFSPALPPRRKGPLTHRTRCRGIRGLMFAYSEGGSKEVFAGIVFRLGMALGTANFMAWMEAHNASLIGV